MRTPTGWRWKTIGFLCLACVVPAGGRSGTLGKAEADRSRLLLIADFDRGAQNHLGGFHNASERAPSSVSMGRSSDVFRGGGGRSLRITANQKTGGFAAAWISFFDTRRVERTYFDARGYSHLSFWVRGKQGGETFRIKLADAAWAAREDGLLIGTVGRFLPNGVTQEWQEVSIPLAGLAFLDRNMLAFLTIDFHGPGETTIFLDDIGFKGNPDIPTPQTPAVAAASAIRRDLPRAMWNWNPLPLLLDPAKRREFLDFCRRQKIGRVWMQLPWKPAGTPKVAGNGIPPLGTDFRIEILHPDRLRSFLAAAHGEGIIVEALDGAPEYSVKKNHHIPLAIVDAVISFNKGSGPAERFDGVHFDIEPYLLVGWHFPDLREQILEEFLEMNLECQRRIRSQAGMVYGIDIPFWWQSIDPQTGRTSAPATLNGVRKAASLHCIDTLDSVGIMNYRNTADGADGMLAHGLDILEYAEKARRARIHMGVETFTEPPADVRFAVGLPRKEVEKILKTRGEEILFLSRINGFRVYVLDDGANLHFGIGMPSRPSPEQDRAARETLVHIAEMLGTSHADLGQNREKELRRTALSRLAQDPEWRDPKPNDIASPSGKNEYAGFQATILFLPKLTFGAKTIREMEVELALAEEEFRDYRQYTGIAIHHYESYLRMIEQSSP